MMSKHTPWIDVARLVAIFGVILIHVCVSVFSDTRSDAITLQITNAFDSLARISVPLFAMISGALLLDKEISFKSIKNRLLKVIIPLIFWSLVYLLYLNHWSALPFDFLNSVILIFKLPAMYHLWFVYMILGIYLVLPILQPISQKLLSDKKFAFYFFVLWFIVNSLTVYVPLNIINLMSMNAFMSWSGFFFLGYYLVNVKFNISRRNLMLLFFLSSLFTFALTWYFNINTSFNPLNETAYNYFSPNVVVSSIAFFLYLKSLTISDSYQKTFAFLSTLVFPVYFMHLLVIAGLTSGILGFSIDQYFSHPAIGIVILSILTLALSFLLSLFAKKVPYLSKLIG